MWCRPKPWLTGWGALELILLISVLPGLNGQTPNAGCPGGCDLRQRSSLQLSLRGCLLIVLSQLRIKPVLAESGWRISRSTTMSVSKVQWFLVAGLEEWRVNNLLPSTYPHFLLSSNLLHFEVVPWPVQVAAGKARSHSPWCMVFCPSPQKVSEVAASESYQVGLGSLWLLPW